MKDNLRYGILILVLVALMLGACQPLVLQSPETTAPQPVESGDEETEASSTTERLVDELIYCTSMEGNLLGEPADREVIVYLPPSYNEHPETRYPVVYLLHGSNGAPTRFIDAGDQAAFYQNFRINTAMDELVALGNVQEMIFVMPDANNRFGGNWYLSSETIGDYETCLTEEVVTYIDTHYRTLAHPNSRGIAGFSMGGYGAMHLGLKYPDIFSVVVAISGHYDREASWKSRLEGAALADPQDWDAFAEMSFFEQSGFALAAGISPNPTKPPFFVDLPFKVVDGEAQVVPEVWEMYAGADVLEGHLAQYLQQEARLNGVMFVHGKTDTFAPVGPARLLDEMMTDMGIDHVYWEHQVSEPGGGHIFIGHYPERWLTFFSERLSSDVDSQ